MIKHEHTAINGGCKDPCTPSPEMPSLRRRGGAGFANGIQAAARLANLSRRETEVLHCIASNQSTKEIAVDLAISPKTVECHRAQIMRKTGCQTLFDLGRLWGLASAAASLEGTDRPQGSVALRTALAAVTAIGQSPDLGHRSRIDQLTRQQLLDRAQCDREDAQRAIRSGLISAAAMMLNDAERCELRAKTLKRATAALATEPLPEERCGGEGLLARPR
ncbi:LuxR C-terminal-related transcriptional regulator [Azospirillum sp. B510]|uniref:LuxR C-terminal-related transcriptional regulator n=1 Tax=Azospirillum sp. (strain B510) TaxID=137722 RepID=UPI000B34A315